eukprot:CAMPEP_0181363396 /NCGR_PEP_ID=MMETSP1106-20121128/8697_1 /TAXON_ID=81844 /ORGANISM="Mantoniella antarctica, Strain SL-175" /LENGTH=174 /DNA_ID=CAMNT_0023477773 /DNA_START=107 /DNA_END=631 /DNA_ORIENTATION=+
MRTYALVVVALCALSAAGVHARELPTRQAMVGGFDVPVEVALSAAFLARAEVAAGHKLPYSNPFTGMCQPTEMKVSISGVPGSFCSPKCGPSAPCPADTHKGATAKGECVLETAGSGSPSQCALICKPGPDRGGCPTGAACVPIQGLGICTYSTKNDGETTAGETQPQILEMTN